MTTEIVSRPKLPAVVPVRRSSRDREFLPAALSIIETPPSPVSMALLVSICLFFAGALVWSWFGRIDIVAVAPGKVQPKGLVKTIQSVETGRVSQIAVTSGMHVAAGQVLFTLDPSEVKATEAELSADVATFTAEALRRSVAAAHARAETTPRIEWPAQIPADVAAAQDRVLASDLEQLRAEVGNLQAQADQKRLEQKRLDMTIAEQSALVDTLKERVDMRTSLLTSGAGPKAAVLDARENYETQATNLAYQTGERAETVAAIRVAETAIQKAYDTFIAENTQKETEAERQAADFANKLATARVKSTRLTVTSPVDGIAHGLTITTDGQVVNTGEEVMRIVPESEALEVEAYLPNEAAGFVRPGEDVIVKVESFPFTRYGTLHGTVVRIASDAISEAEAQQSVVAPAKQMRDTGLAGAQEMQSLVYPITIRLAQSSIKADGRTVPLSPGMAVSAEIKTGSRRLLDYVLSPILEVASTSLHER